MYPPPCRRLLCICSTFLLLLAAGAAPAAAPPCPGSLAPPLVFTDLETGEARTLRQVADGGPVLVVFLQTACRTCAREMVGLKRIMAKTPNCPVVGVFIDLKPRGLASYVALYGLPFTFTWDEDGSLAEAWGVSLSPTSFLVDREGRVAAVYAGFKLATERTLCEDLGRLAARE